MSMPTDVPIIDLMFGFPILDHDKTYASLRAAAHDKESKEFTFPAEYMFRGVPKDWGRDRDPIEATLEEMDKWNIERAMVGISQEASLGAIKAHRDRFIPQVHVDPNDGMDAVRAIQRAYDEVGVKAVGSFPAGTHPQVAISDAKYYPIYAKCCELDIAMFINAGVPGPRMPMACQHVEHLDIVCYDFPELRLVTYHGCEPWEKLAWKLMLKWPGLHYCTSAFAPKYYPTEIVDYANTRGADKILYAGYFPMGLSIERIMTEMRDVPFRDHVWPKFLRENAIRVLKLDD